MRNTRSFVHEACSPARNSTRRSRGLLDTPFAERFGHPTDPESWERTTDFFREIGRDGGYGGREDDWIARVVAADFCVWSEKMSRKDRFNPTLRWMLQECVTGWMIWHNHWFGKDDDEAVGRLGAFARWAKDGTGRWGTGLEWTTKCKARWLRDMIRADEPGRPVLDESLVLTAYEATQAGRIPPEIEIEDGYSLEVPFMRGPGFPGHNRSPETDEFLSARTTEVFGEGQTGWHNAGVYARRLAGMWMLNGASRTVRREVEESLSVRLVYYGYVAEGRKPATMRTLLQKIESETDEDRRRMTAGTTGSAREILGDAWKSYVSRMSPGGRESMGRHDGIVRSLCSQERGPRDEAVLDEAVVLGAYHMMLHDKSFRRTGKPRSANRVPTPPA